MPPALIRSRLEAYKRQHGRCYYCGLPMWLGDPTAFAQERHITEKQALRLQCTAEHLIARQDGGKDSPGNIAAACKFCNHTRHKIAVPPPPPRYRKHVLARMRRGAWHPGIYHRLIEPTCRDSLLR
jgi:hypothetical protein